MLVSRDYQSSDSSSWVPIVASVGLFVLTAALSSQWAKDSDEQSSEIDEDERCKGTFHDLQFQYNCWRTQDRLSYEHLPDASKSHSWQSPISKKDSLPMEVTHLIPSSDLAPSGLTEWELHRQQNHSFRSIATAQHPMLDRRDSHPNNSVGPRHHPNANYDFHPKNKNWRHFESFSELDHDHVLRSPKQNSVRLETARVYNKEPIHKNGPEVDCSKDWNLDESSTSGSESSEEHFVWTQSHRTRDNTEAEKDMSWPEAIRKKVPSLLNLFLEHHPDESIAPTNNGPVGLAPSTEIKAHQNSSFNIQVEQPPPHAMVGRANSDHLPYPEHTIPYAKRLYVSTSELKDDILGAAPSVDEHRLLRAHYNANIMPEKVILVRHGQSLGNINELLYSTIPDNAMPLTRLGWEQARKTGEILKKKILGRNETVHFIVSPYVRTVETFHGIVSAWCDPKEFSHIANKDKRIKAWYGRLMEMGLTWNEDSRIREQDFGNYQDPETIKRAKQERHRFGVFFYRFPHGESASDVFDRVCTFLDSLWRSFEMSKSRNYVLVTHGISIRVFLARYFRYTIDQFNILANPKNCEMIVLGHNGHGRLELQGRCELEIGSKSGMNGNDNKNSEDTKGEQDNKHVTGWKFQKRLRIIPKQAIRKVTIRISPDD